MEGSESYLNFCDLRAGFFSARANALTAALAAAADEHSPAASSDGGGLMADESFAGPAWMREPRAP